MKRVFSFIQILLLVFSSQILLGGCNYFESDEIANQKRIKYYDIFIEMDPSQSIFYSKQSILITGNLAKGKKLSIFISDRLMIDQLTMQDEQGNNIIIKNWKNIDSYTTENWWGTSVTSEISIETEEKLTAYENLVVNLEYHLPEEEFQEGLASNIYELFVSPLGSHAGGPESGAFAMVSGSLEAPFKITINHPDSFLCAVPGEKIDSNLKNEFVTEIFEAENSYDPSFSCAPYKVLSKELQDMKIELFFPETIQLQEGLLNTAEEILNFYLTSFGESSARSLRIVFPNLDNNDGGGESNGNLILLGNVTPFLVYDEESKEMFSQLIAHEGYHLWNTWSLDWQGDLEEWWVEGGASFMASWTHEVLFGVGSAAANRLDDLEIFNEQEAFNHKNTLANLDENWFEDYTLVYSYGALVWEQLRQEVGSEILAAALLDFYTTFKNQTVDFEDFSYCLEKHTDINISESLQKWTEHNAIIDLSIQEVSIQTSTGGYEIRVSYNIEADQDYEIYTSLGYKTSIDGKWNLIELNPVETGQQEVIFDTDSKPVLIQIDPEYRVPQINLGNNSWSADNLQY